jgi:hypothetical protein
MNTDVAQINTAVYNAEHGPDGPTPITLQALKKAGLTLKTEATTDARQPTAPNVQVASAWGKVLSTSATYGSDAGTDAITRMTADEKAVATALQDLAQAESENGIS